jgi:hypothetical protein
VYRCHLIVGEHLSGLERIAQMPVRPRAVENGMADIGAAGSASRCADRPCLQFVSVQVPVVLGGKLL